MATVAPADEELVADPGGQGSLYQLLLGGCQIVAGHASQHLTGGDIGMNECARSCPRRANSPRG